MSNLSLNAGAQNLADEFAVSANELRARVSTSGGVRIIDCGVKQLGGLEAGRRLAEICLAGLAQVSFVPARAEFGGGLAVCVSTDQPVAACMASQYAGWQIAAGKFFAMGSGPMRAAGSREKLFDEIGFREQPPWVVGVLETSKLPPDEVCEQLARDCSVAPENFTLLCASVHSMAGTVQVVARAAETALHKLHTLGYELTKIVSGYGTAPLPTVASNFLDGIGRTNDAVLYGGEVTLWVRDDDARLAEIGPLVPSSASADYGEPFRAIFERYGGDFYKIDPKLFSPAIVRFVNLATGTSFRFGQLNPSVFATSNGE